MWVLSVEQKNLENGRATIILSVDWKEKAHFSLKIDSSVQDVVEQFERALQWIPKKIEMTQEGVVQLVWILIPELKTRLKIQWNSQEEARENLLKIVENMQHNFLEAFSVSWTGTRLRGLLWNTWYYHSKWREESYFDFWSFLEEQGVFYTIYSRPWISLNEAKKILKANLSIWNTWDKTFDLLIDVLKKSWFNIWE